MDPSWACEVCGAVAHGEVLPTLPNDTATAPNESTATLRERGLVSYRDPAVVAELLAGFLWVGNASCAKPSVFLPLGALTTAVQPYISALICLSALSTEHV